jgi:hypothetical protein
LSTPSTALVSAGVHRSVIFVALYPHQIFKACFPAAKFSSVHLSLFFIPASMQVLASKIICDNMYSNKSIVGQGMSALRESNQMEHEMFSYLEWQLNVNPSTLRDFESRVRHAGPGPCLMVVLPQTAPAPFAHSANPSIPSFTTRLSLSQDAPVIPSPPIAYTSSPSDTPEASHSTSTSPALPVSPQTPPEVHGPGLIKVASAELSPADVPFILSDKGTLNLYTSKHYLHSFYF